MEVLFFGGGRDGRDCGVGGGGGGGRRREEMNGGEVGRGDGYLSGVILSDKPSEIHGWKGW